MPWRRAETVPRPWIAIGRVGAGAALAVYVLTYPLLNDAPQPDYVTRLGVGVAALLAVLGVAQLLPGLRASHSMAVACLGFDAAAAVGFLWLYSFDPARYIVSLAFLVVIEGTLVAGIAGGLVAWAGMTGGYLVTELSAAVLSGAPSGPVAIALRVSVGLVLAVVVGALVRQLSAERAGRVDDRVRQNRRLHEVVFDVDAIVWEADAAGADLTYVSPSVERILGYPVERWLEEPGFRTKITLPADRQRVAARYAEAVRSGRHCEVEYRVAKAGEQVIWIRDRVNPVLDDAGRVQGLRGVMRDISKKKGAEEGLRAGFGLLFENNPQPMWAYDRGTLKILAVNDAAVELYGYSRDELLDMQLSDLCQPEEVDRLLLEMIRNRGALDRSGEWRHRDRDGRLIEVVLTSHTLEFEGHPATLVAAEDVTEQKQTRRKLREAEARYRTLVEQIPAVTYIGEIDEHRTPIYMSPQVQKLLGYSQAEWREQVGLWSTLVHPEDQERTLAEVARARERGDRFASEYRMVARDGRIVWVRDEAVTLRDEDGQPRFWHGLMMDVTERKRAEQEMEFLAYHDELTHLPNRAMLQEVLELSMSRARRRGLSVAVLMLDLDDFKSVNDTLGHLAGDEVLRQLAGRLRDATRETDLVARLGGDEFVVLLADLEPPSVGNGSRGQPGHQPRTAAEMVGRRVHRSLQDPFTVEGQEVQVAASIGLAVFPEDASDATSLLARADASMYRAKRGGVSAIGTEHAD